MKISPIELSVLLSIPPSEYRSAARFEDIERRFGPAVLTSVHRLVQLGLVDSVVAGIYRRTVKGDVLVEANKDADRDATEVK